MKKERDLLLSPFQKEKRKKKKEKEICFIFLFGFELVGSKSKHRESLEEHQKRPVDLNGGGASLEPIT